MNQERPGERRYYDVRNRMADTDAVRCPQCRSIDVRFSHRRLWDHVLSWFKLEVFRCRNCRKRFRERIVDAEEVGTESSD